jgi:hypothetical protein
MQLAANHSAAYPIHSHWLLQRRLWRHSNLHGLVGLYLLGKELNLVPVVVSERKAESGQITSQIAGRTQVRWH